MIGFHNFIEALIRDNVVPGLVMLAGRGDQALYRKECGFLALTPEKEPIRADAIYDLASLTKPLITALLTIIILEKEHIPLDTPARNFIPGLTHKYTLRNLLTHNSGLPAWYPFYLYTIPALEQVMKFHKVGRPNKKVEYSCVGYIVIHDILERITGMPFQRCVQEMIIAPLGLTRTFLNVPESLKNECAPTETGNDFERKMAQKEHAQAAAAFAWRTGLIRGEAHDCNSFYLGGCAGNAGLFSNAGDIFQLSRQFYPQMATLLKPESCAVFWKNFTPFRLSHRSVGFKLNSSTLTCGGRAISSQAIGHSGFTGTSLWLEPENGFTYIILSNRIHPGVEKSCTRGNINFNKVRRRLHQYLKAEAERLGRERV